MYRELRRAAACTEAYRQKNVVRGKGMGVELCGCYPFVYLFIRTSPLHCLCRPPLCGDSRPFHRDYLSFYILLLLLTSVVPATVSNSNGAATATPATGGSSPLHPPQRSPTQPTRLHPARTHPPYSQDSHHSSQRTPRHRKQVLRTRRMQAPRPAKVRPVQSRFYPGQLLAPVLEVCSRRSYSSSTQRRPSSPASTGCHQPQRRGQRV